MSKPDKIAGIELLKTLPLDYDAVDVIDIIAAKKASEFLEMSDYQLRTLISPGASIMARPCPIKPRHGFVPSRVVGSVDEIVSIAREVVEAEPDAWLMLNRYINARYSAVVTPAVVAVGRRNDGVTSGARSVTLPIRTNFPELLVSKCLEILVESFSPGFKIHLVQAKSMDGVTVPGLLDYIPRPAVVVKVVHANDFTDLEWEKYVRRVSNEGSANRIVAYMPGASLLSHKALWCIAYGIPVVTTYEPKSGEELAPTWSNKVDLAPEQYRAALHYGLHGIDFSGSVPSKIIWAAAHAIHHCAALSLHTEGVMFTVAALAAFAKLMFAACVGEARYVSSSYCSGFFHNLGDLGDLHALFDCASDSGHATRRMACNELVINRHSAGKLRRLASAFGRLTWANKNYGGPAWETMATHTERLIVHLLEGNIDRALAEANTLLHLEHNSSLVITKYVGGGGQEIQEKLSLISAGDFGMLMEALPGIANLCEFLIDKMDIPVPKGPVLDTYGSALMPSYYGDTKSPVISCQETVGRDGRYLLTFVGHALRAFGLQQSDGRAPLIEGDLLRVCVDRGGETLHEESVPLNDGYSREDPPHGTHCELLRFVPSNPVVYHYGSKLGIEVDGKLWSIDADLRLDDVVYHVGDGRNGIPIVVAAPAQGERIPSVTEHSPPFHNMLQEYGFGLNFTEAEAATAYSVACYCVGYRMRHHAFSGWGHIENVMLGMALRYCVGLALANHNRHYGPTPLNEVLDVSIRNYPFGLALVDGRILYEEVRTHAGVLFAALESGRTVTPNILSVKDTLMYALLAITRGIDYGLEVRLGCKFFDMRYRGFLGKRFVWDMGSHQAVEVRIPDNATDMHYLDIVHGLAMIKRAIDRQGTGGGK